MRNPNLMTDDDIDTYLVTECAFRDAWISAEIRQQTRHRLIREWNRAVKAQRTKQNDEDKIDRTQS